MRIRIDAILCQGHGRCWETAPDLVDDDEEGRGVVRHPDGDVPTGFEAQAQSAANACPERAVVLDG
jgi:ferredoxin